MASETFDAVRIQRGYHQAAKILLDEAKPDGTWEGELSSSPLSTATAVVALELVRRRRPERHAELEPLIAGGLRWLTEHQNSDGGWGDTILSHSNISTTTLAYASFSLLGLAQQDAALRAKMYVDANGGFDAIRKRYGKDRTFSVPILTQCALAGLIPWSELTPLPFELGWLPHWFYRWIRLPVVSYALPALIAIGQARHHHAPSWNPIIRMIRQLAVAPTLRRLEALQPESGGFLEATPLTSFVTMSLASMEQADHPVARRGVEFLQASVRADGSWPIDTNLAIWVTTLSVNALMPESLSPSNGMAIAAWLLSQQHRKVHRYTNAAAGGWSWTDLSGGVPDADDTPGAVLALLKLNPQLTELPSALSAAIGWLLDLQNNDGGWPTFCRGWGALPFDRSTADLTAHALRAISEWKKSACPDVGASAGIDESILGRLDAAVDRGFTFLARTQRTDGTWLPLWFGNQFAEDDENPVYGVSRVLSAYREWSRLADPEARRAITWLASVQNSDGGWGGAANTPSSTEETALALEILLSLPDFDPICRRGLDWLLGKVETDGFRNPAPIGLYFAKLWYFERLYPIIFTVAALARSVERVNRLKQSGL